MICRVRAFGLLAGLFIVAAAATARAGEAPRLRKIVFIAGPLDKGHPRGTHEYEKVVCLLKHCLDHSPDGKVVSTEVSFGWPNEEKSLDGADAIVIICSGANRNEADHVLFTGNRFDVIEKQMKRGCGLAFIHWGVFVPKDKGGDKILEWIGGYFDYETGPKPKGWYSKIKFANTEAVPRAITPLAGDWPPSRSTTSGTTTCVSASAIRG